MKYEITNIKWDTDGNDVELPESLKIEVPDGYDSLETDDYISDEISNITGYCHKGFSVTEKAYELYREKPYPTKRQAKAVAGIVSVHYYVKIVPSEDGYYLYKSTAIRKGVFEF